MSTATFSWTHQARGRCSFVIWAEHARFAARLLWDESISGTSGYHLPETSEDERARQARKAFNRKAQKSGKRKRRRGFFGESESGPADPWDKLVRTWLLQRIKEKTRDDDIDRVLFWVHPETGAVLRIWAYDEEAYHEDPEDYLVEYDRKNECWRFDVYGSFLRWEPNTWREWWSGDSTHFYDPIHDAEIWDTREEIRDGIERSKIISKTARVKKRRLRR